MRRLLCVSFSAALEPHQAKLTPAPYLVMRPQMSYILSRCRKAPLSQPFHLQAEKLWINTANLLLYHRYQS